MPGFGVVAVLIGLTLLGFLAANIAGRTLLRIGEAMVDRTPVVRGLYKGFKQIFETVFSQGGDQFRRVGLVEFPMKGAWSVVFISSEPARAVADALPEQPMTSVFLPCTPNPTTGFYFFVPTADLIEIDMTPENAAKLVMSAGLIQPEGQVALAAMAQGGAIRQAERRRRRRRRAVTPPPQPGTLGAATRLNLCYQWPAARASRAFRSIPAAPGWQDGPRRATIGSLNADAADF